MEKIKYKVRDFALNFGISIQPNYRMPVVELLEKIWPVEIEDDLKRIGSSEGDGGYLVPQSNLSPDRVFSPGVASNSDFENYFLERQIPCHLLDGSISSPPVHHKMMTFEKKWLASTSSSNSWSLDDWVSNHAKPKESLLLQMDIEGAEFDVLLSASRSTLDRFTVIVVELHELSMVTNRHGLKLLNLLLEKLLLSHRVVHAHPNNCCPGVEFRGFAWPEVIELTLVHKNQTGLFTERPAQLPHALDKPNTPGPEIILKK